MNTYIHFLIENQDYILDTSDIHYISSLDSVKFIRLPTSDKKYIQGIYVGRDKETRVGINLKKFCNIESSQDERYMIALSVDYGIMVDEVVNIFEANNDNFQDSPFKDDLITKIYKSENKLLRLLNVDNIIINSENI